ncbi:DNA polymerase [Novosphingobium sp. PhB165]|uniref:UdgX family uracil-DNA binding protein n=1 Tax=Novosphingobium sp. PhB165 TaxID=2485105 RepID=UPI0010495EF5|nr:UdgX family uracil-DNA binding protein [Novosphingobium sp. PhB165]TCM14367.1 DNA polymerase [Novosphingobium sp. PhB165]
MCPTARSRSSAQGPPRSGGERKETQFQNLDALYKTLQDEDMPPTSRFSDRLVLGKGPVHARLMLIGEQPGDQEDRAGLPFVGPAGKLLDACLQEAAIPRNRVFVTNAVKRFKFAQRGKRRLHQRPTSDEIVHYRWWLEQEIRLVDPAVLVTLGATALQAVLGKRQTLGPLRGNVMCWEGRQLVVTVHPSFLLRLRDASAKAVERSRLVSELGKAWAMSEAAQTLSPWRNRNVPTKDTN